MIFNVEKSTTKGIEIISISHDEKRIDINVSGYQGIHVKRPDELFVELNIFIKKYDKEDLNRLFEIYTEVKDYCVIDAEPFLLNFKLNTLVKEMYEILGYSKFRTFVLVDMHLPIAPGCNTQMDPEKSYDRSITYLKEDYEDLLILVMALRFMLPIWGAYLPLAKKYAENFHKEKFSLLLLDDSAITTWASYITLQNYIESHKTIHMANYGLLKHALTVDEIPSYFLAMVLIRKLALAVVSYVSDEDDLVKIIYNTIKSFDDQLKSRSVTDIKDPTKTISDRDDDNSSVWDIIRVKEKISTGDRALINVYASDPFKIVDRLDPYLDLNKLEICLSVCDVMTKEPTMKHHDAFCIWALGKVMSPNAVRTLYHYNYVKIMAITQAYLWHYGMEYLALLVTSSPIEREVGGSYSGIDGRSKLPKEYIQDLQSIYRFYKMKDRNDKKVGCVAIDAIDIVTESLLNYNWRYKGPEQLLENFSDIKTTYTLSPDYGVKVLLADFIKKINEPTRY